MKKEGRAILQDKRLASWREGNGPEGPVRKPNNQSTADPSSVCLPTCPWFATAYYHAIGRQPLLALRAAAGYASTSVTVEEGT